MVTICPADFIATNSIGSVLKRTVLNYNLRTLWTVITNTELQEKGHYNCSIYSGPVVRYLLFYV